MNKCLYICAVFLLLRTTPLPAQPWEFTAAQDITSSTGPGIFHHLDSSGRQNIAVAGHTIAVVWEDNRNGTPHVYLARKSITDKAFTKAIKISAQGEAYEPSITALDKGRFIIAWEEDARIYTRLVTAAGLGPVVAISQAQAFQASVTKHRQYVLVVYSQLDKKYQRIRLQQLEIDGLQLRRVKDCPVDQAPASDEQQYPAALSLGERLMVAWEDRRPGHTIIMAANSKDKSLCSFSTPQRISEGMSARSSSYGKGHGVARVALGRYRTGQAFAVWADKRDFREGYDIYAAKHKVGDKKLFGPNKKVQDSFGGIAKQWHPAIAGHNAGMVVVAWDDDRDGDANIMLSWLQENDWSDDIEVEGGSGEGEQTHPTLYLDKDLNLHMALIERSKIGAPTRLRYVFGKYIK